MEYLVNRRNPQLKENDMFYLYRITGTILVIGGFVGLLIRRSQNHAFNSLICVLVGLGYFGLSCLFKEKETKAKEE